MKILLYRWIVFNQEDISAAFERQGHKVDMYEEPEESRKQEYSPVFCDLVREYDAIFTVNYFPRLSNICQRLGKRYIVWTVDSPMIAMHHQSIYNSCNHLFVFDKVNYYEFLSMGVGHLHYLPLAVDVSRVDELLKATPEEEMEQYKSDISFVGGLYYKNSYDEVSDKLSPYLQGYFDAAMMAQMDLFGENLFDRLLTPDILEQLCEQIDFVQDEDYLSDIGLVFSSTYLGFKMAQLERIECLNRLATRHQVKLYSDRSHPSLKHVDFRGSVNYLHDMPKVFHASKINMNFTMRNIRSGIPLRIWDVLGAGGFMLTNFQAELPAYFGNGKDLVFYESLGDMEDKAQYYLTHEEERRAIALHGYETVKRMHTYDHRITEILTKIREDDLQDQEENQNR